MGYDFQKDISGCGLTGVINTRGELTPGSLIIESLLNMEERGNGLGAGFAAYGIYPHLKEFYALHLMYEGRLPQDKTEDYLRNNLTVQHQEPIPTRPLATVKNPPIFMRYFVMPRLPRGVGPGELPPQWEDDAIVNAVMKINFEMEGAFVVSSGKNMGVFKGVGFPGEMAEFFRIEDYNAYIWTGHARFPTNTPGWWGGAHPFTLLDWSIVHNGEISSYGINKRYLEMNGYRCTLFTDTEVVAYLLDLFIRKHGLSIELACTALAPPFWKNIDKMEEGEQEALTALRMVYGSGVLNGPFAILFGHGRGLVGFNDRIKLRPLMAAQKGQTYYMASEEAAIRAICPEPDRVWAPKAGEPIIVSMEDGLPS